MRLGLLLCAAACLPGVAQAQASAVMLSQYYAQMVPGQTLAFSASVGGGGGQSVIWQVNKVVGGNARIGTITSAGVFTAPAGVPASGLVTVTAVSAQSPQSSATASVTLTAQPPAGQTYYVASTGADTNAGTLGHPFATIQHAADIAMAGDTVLVRQGTYNALVVPPHSGNANAGYITFSAYPGEAPVIDGTGLTVPGGQAGLVTLQDVSYVIVQGFVLRNYTTAKRSQVPIGIFVTGGGQNEQVLNNHITDITTTAPTSPAACASGAQSANALGLAVYGSRAPIAIGNLSIAGNELDAMKTGCSETMTVNGNVDGFTIAGNYVHDDNNIGIDAIGFEQVSPNATYDQARHGEIRGNLVLRTSSYGNPAYGKMYAADGIYVDGGKNIVIEQNIVSGADLGIEIASENKGRLTSSVIVRNNLVYGNTSNGISIGGYGPNQGGTQDCTIVNNSLYLNDTKNTGSGELQIQYNATGNVIENNIAYATAQALFLHDYPKVSTAPAMLDYNLYYTASKTASRIWIWEGVRDVGLPTYQARSGQDAHAIFADPEYTGALVLAAGSPALGAGANLGASVIGSVDFAGRPRAPGGAVSIGAFAH